ncbi:MAG: thrS [Solirubrobacterales bacterium]|nr:thrS [Solirubrobacterales bacterium]
MTVTLPDGTQLELPDGATGADAAGAIGEGLLRAALAVKYDGEVHDLHAPLPGDVALEIITQRSGQDALDLVRHDTAHVLAAAMLELYPGVKISIGPAIEDGFYYDFEFPEGVSFTDADFPAVEKKMKEHVKAAETFTREDISTDAALERFRAEDQPYKVELIEDLVRNTGVETVSLYTNGPFTDLCRGPHAPTTKRIGAFKLQSVAGAYWRGDSTRTMLTRVYGTAFFDKKELAAHLELLEEAKKRDHRKLGRELGLYYFSEAAPGSAFWTPAGTTVFNQLVALSREMGEDRGYTEVKTPQLYDAELWKKSGHWDKYQDDMFLTSTGDERPMGFKPMNCPGHFELFGQSRWSYKDLPVRFSEPGLLHRNELSGALHGLLRVRQFCQDDAHLFVTDEQLLDEITACIAFARDTYELFGFTDADIRYELSTRPENRLGTEEFWDTAEDILAQALKANGLAYEIGEGGGAFYAPKIDFHFTDSLKRSWQLGTVQLDYLAPERFDLTYTGADNADHRPVVLHRALMGSYERFIGILLEHTGGELPFWLTPVQAIVLPIADRHAEAALAAAATLRTAGLRVETDDRTESVGRKIRDAELRKVPYMLVVGDREAEEGTVSVRRHREGDTGTETVAALAQRLSADSAARVA